MGPGPIWISLKLLVTNAATSLPYPWRRVALALTLGDTPAFIGAPRVPSSGCIPFYVTLALLRGMIIVSAAVRLCALIQLFPRARLTRSGFEAIATHKENLISDCD